jgi:hypothetical protein
MDQILTDYDQNDINVIKWQLNTDCVNMSGIVRKCIYGYPAIILLSPAEYKPESSSKKLNFMALSNPLWLTCPYLNKKVHEFESAGYIKKITNLIRSDRALVELMKNAHANYYFLRRNLYSMEFGEISSLEFSSKVLHAGIGGIKEIDNIKCLHQHYSHFQVCDDNIPGRIVFNLLNGITYCRERLCDNASE